MLFKLEKFLDRLVVWYMLKRWHRAHSAEIYTKDYVVRLYSRCFYKRNIDYEVTSIRKGKYEE